MLLIIIYIALFLFRHVSLFIVICLCIALFSCSFVMYLIYTPCHHFVTILYNYLIYVFFFMIIKKILSYSVLIPPPSLPPTHIATHLLLAHSPTKFAHSTIFHFYILYLLFHYLSMMILLQSQFILPSLQ